MTVVTFASVKGSPGVTTLTCLVAAEWPHTPTPIVVECDPAGGDLAARFELSSRCGWPSLAASLRREASWAGIEEHLQRLPGGVDVLVGTEGTGTPEHAVITHVLDRAQKPDARDLVVDLGRLPVREEVGDSWLAGADEIVLVSRADPPSLIAVQRRSVPLADRWGSKLGLVVVGPHRHRVEEIETFTGIRLLATIPWDPSSAAAASGERRGRRRLSRSRLMSSVGRLAAGLARTRSAAVSSSAPEPHDTSPSAS